MIYSGFIESDANVMPQLAEVQFYVRLYYAKTVDGSYCVRFGTSQRKPKG